MATAPPPIVVGPPEEGDEGRLARTLIELHGADAAKVARENARSAALAGRLAQAKHWLRVVGSIQRLPTASA